MRSFAPWWFCPAVKSSNTPMYHFITRSRQIRCWKAFAQRGVRLSKWERQLTKHSHGSNRAARRTCFGGWRRIWSPPICANVRWRVGGQRVVWRDNACRRRKCAVAVVCRLPDEKPVANGVLFNGAGVASVYGVGTIASAGGQGIGAAITPSCCSMRVQWVTPTVCCFPPNWGIRFSGVWVSGMSEWLSGSTCGFRKGKG